MPIDVEKQPHQRCFLEVLAIRQYGLYVLALSVKFQRPKYIQKSKIGLGDLTFSNESHLKTI